MPGVEIRLRSGALTVAARVRERTAQLEAAALVGAQQIADEAQSVILPAALPKPAVRATLRAEALPSRGYTLARVRLVSQGDKPLWKWWFYGTQPHPIDPRGDNARGLLVFYWKRYGRTVAFTHVNHPGAVAHLADRTELLTLLRDVAREVWTQQLGDTLRGQ